MGDNNVELRQEVFKSDASIIANWLEDTEITQYLNEKQNVSKSIKDIMYRINMPILTHLFNQNGSFFMVTTNEKEPVGFLRLVPKNSIAEMVIVIGDKDKWGKGLGTNAILEGLKHAFFQWRVDEVVAKINFKNQRSRRVFRKIGFTEDKELAKEMQYSMSIKEFLQLVA
ncbi:MULTISPECIES: GNAT family N-acetyltransferase [Clostridium]|uniref:GNAT family N-acetyltransferase n=1 Tax=Clostridium sporogenes TaxID=1509 RepID=A0A7X5PCL2_CLOSG|nr:GNAT family protein [Clostridium sporogenes]AJD33003.1 acetyltransferase family protein [Clostridium botulinum Prevot_594]AVP60662.1 N-acetyltransferase [Clostridium botulinum]AKC61094.1 GNAT family acetyltransferase [Clostridium sporogenes]AKJ88445.1 GNAT family acetyltransferase [Clostridium sporogenes]KCZ69992.1 GNAT family acetyltransferase [Clostridium sporogenes]